MTPTPQKSTNNKHELVRFHLTRRVAGCRIDNRYRRPPGWYMLRNEEDGTTTLKNTKHKQLAFGTRRFGRLGLTNNVTGLLPVTVL
jgi:hypothetical protein